MKFKTKDTIVTETGRSVYDCPITEYACDECGANFLDRDDNYAYCPYCGRKIVDIYVEDINVPIN